MCREGLSHADSGLCHTHDGNRWRNAKMEEMTILELQKKMDAGEYSARTITEAYLERIEQIDRRGPTGPHDRAGRGQVLYGLHAVLRPERYAGSQNRRDTQLLWL